MTPEAISQTYEMLERLEIKLEQTPELGTEYLKDKLLECRQKQNTVTDLIVKTNRAYSGARMAVRAQESAVRVAGQSQRGPELRDELLKMLDERDALKYLLEALNVRRANLGRTSSDIRLMAGIIEQESRPGVASAGPERPKPAPPVPTALPPLDVPAATAPTGTFAEGIAEVVAKAKAEGKINETPIVDPADVLKASEPSPVSEEKAAVLPPPPMLADDEVDIDAFLES